MRSHNFLKESPLTFTPFIGHYNDAVIAPGSPRFLITEDGKYITTEDGKYIVTEN